MKLQVFDAEYETNPLKLILYGKNGEGTYKIVDQNFRPYFYAMPTDLQQLKKDVEEKEFESDKGDKLEIIETSVEEKKYDQETVKALKIVTDVPANVPKLKNALWGLESVRRCLEFDIPFYRRYLIDKEIRPGEWIEVKGEKKASENFEAEIDAEKIDTRVDSEKSVKWSSMAFDLEVIDDKVVMASFRSEEFRKLLSLKDVDLDFVEKVEDEKEMLKRFIEIVEENNVDILTGYNTD